MAFDVNPLNFCLVAIEVADNKSCIFLVWEDSLTVFFMFLFLHWKVNGKSPRNQIPCDPISLHKLLVQVSKPCFLSLSAFQT